MEHDLVIAGTDGSDDSLRAVEWAAGEAALRGATLRIVSAPALPPVMPWHQPLLGKPDVIADAVIELSEQALASAACRAAAAEPAVVVQTVLEPGRPAQALIKAAAGASMIVVASSGSGGIPGRASGPVSQSVATRAGCPVVVVRKDGLPTQREIVVGIRDLDQPAAITFAFEEAALRRARLRAVHAWRWFPPKVGPAATRRSGAVAQDVMQQTARWLTELLGFWQEKFPEVDVVEDVRRTSPGRVLAASSATADLVVLGRNAPEDIEHRYANAVTHAVLNHAHGPVAIVPE